MKELICKFALAYLRPALRTLAPEVATQGEYRLPRANYCSKPVADSQRAGKRPRLQWRIQDLREGCPKYYAHAHNIAGRGHAHDLTLRRRATRTGRPDNSALCVRVARAYPRVFLAFVGFRWPPTVAGSFG